MTRTNWKLKPIEGFRFLWKGASKGRPFQTIPAKKTIATEGTDFYSASVRTSNRSTAGHMAGNRMTGEKDAAQAMLDAFVGVGAESFHVTWTNRKGDKTGYRKEMPANTLRHFLPAMLAGTIREEKNLIVRPLSRRAVFIQLDDLDTLKMQRAQPAAFLCLQTSPGNYQAWLALPPDTDKDFVRRLKKGAGADDTASGSTRVAGSLNIKEKYAPNYPRVEITHRAHGRMASEDELTRMGLVAEAEPPPKLSTFRVSPRHTGTKKWPSYERCVQGAPPNRDNTGPDISRADFTWCMTAISWGHGIEAAAVQLMEESPKARENGERYALLTAQNAAAAVERRQRSRA
jgi:hypothetical protein